MIFGQLVSAARLFAQFHAGTKNFSRTFDHLVLLKWSIKFILIPCMKVVIYLNLMTSEYMDDVSIWKISDFWATGKCSKAVCR